VKDLKALPINLNDYGDEKQCYDYSTDEYFLWVLCWAGWREKRQEDVWAQVRNIYAKIGKKLNELKPNEIKKICDAYPLGWQKKWANELINYLESKNLTSSDFIDGLRQLGYENARLKLQKIVKTDAEKIVDCWLRDIVKLDAFPIDSRIRKLLKTYGVPDDSNFIINCCNKNNIPIRPLARAIYENADKL
jgi:hypothetical protein